VPYVLQLNKRDLPSALPADELRARLSIKGEPMFEATAVTGAGVFETLKGIAREVLLDLRKRRVSRVVRPASAAR
jgi:signal recognition particle receptor subunit beta